MLHDTLQFACYNYPKPPSLAAEAEEGTIKKNEGMRDQQQIQQANHNLFMSNSIFVT